MDLVKIVILSIMDAFGSPKPKGSAARRAAAARRTQKARKSSSPSGSDKVGYGFKPTASNIARHAAAQAAKKGHKGGRRTIRRSRF